MPTKETFMEDSLIQQLISGQSQWVLREDIKNEEQLWDNFRQKLNSNNQAVLDGQLITDSEMQQIKDFISRNSQTPYKAALWLAGERGIAQIPVQREDVSRGTISLEVINNREIAGGRSSYEVIHQYQIDKNVSAVMDQKARFDVTLLINGIPLIQIELKQHGNSYMDAFRQVQRYMQNSKFRGLFGMVQMFVVTNGSGTRYFAADTIERLNEQFLTRWVDKDNRPVEDYIQFAREALEIPTAHEMIGKYSVEDMRQLTIRCLEWILTQNEVPATRPEACGNYLLHDLPMCKWESKRYLDRLKNDFHCEYTKLEVKLDDGKVFADA